MAELTIKQKKDYAQLLYTQQGLNGKQVADRAGVSEKTISKWVTEGNWKEVKNRLSISKSTELHRMYQQVEKLNSKIEASDDGYADSKQADVLVKYAACIRSLEQDLNIAEVVESGMKFIQYLQTVENYDTVVQVTTLWDGFIQNQISKL